MVANLVEYEKKAVVLNFVWFIYMPNNEKETIKINKLFF